MGKIKSDKENILFCHYSGLPSPLAYDADYDGMGNQGRFPESKKKEKGFMKRLIQKIIFWFSIKKKSKRKSIWEL